MDTITYYFFGFLTGVSVIAFFIGKEFYKYFIKCTIQQKQLDLILKLNNKINKLKSLNSIQNLNLTNILLN
jgi:hypothetical protein